LIYEIPTRYDEQTLKITVSTSSPQKIRLTVRDKDLPNTVFTDRYKTVNGEACFYVRMPVSGSTALIYVYNEDNGNLAQGQDNTFVVNDISKEDLEKKLDVIDFTNPYVQSFVTFATKFCFNAGWIASGTYVSDDRRFVIEYMPILTDDSGNEVTTPARISITDGMMQVSQRQFVQLSVPNRMAIMLHEFSHYYLNDNMDDEIEADLNGLLIYLGLGYPRIEAYEVFSKTFMNAPTEENMIRYQRIVSFIDNFDNHNFYFYE
jgi:hypothetical protein